MTGPIIKAGAPTQYTPISLQHFLVRLIWLCMLPLLALAAYLAFDNIQTDQADRDAAAERLAINFSTAIDHNLEARIGALEVLAASPHADRQSDWKDLYLEAQGYRYGFAGHVIFADASMQLRFHTRFPFGTSLSKVPSPAGNLAGPAAVNTGEPAIGDILVGPISKETLVSIAVPVLREGRVTAALISNIEIAQFQNRVEEISLPSGWSIALLDGTGAAIARRAPPGVNAADFDPSRRVVVKSALSPWSVALDVPRNVYRAQLADAIAAMVIAIFGATLAGILGGSFATHRLVHSLSTLVGRSTPGAPESRIAEIATIRRRLDESADKQTAAEVEKAGSELRFRSIFEQSAMGIALVGLDGRFLKVNQKFCDFIGGAFDEYRDKSIWDITHPDDIERDKAGLAQLLTGEIQAYAMEKRYLRKDGEFVWGRVSVSLARQRDGRPFHFIGVIEDIQRRKEAEAALADTDKRFRAMIENATDLIVMIDARGTILYASPALQLLGGYAPAEVLGRSIMEFTHPDDLTAAAQALAAVMADPQGPHRAEIRWRSKDGNAVVLESVAKNELDNPSLRAIIINARDVTARRVAENEIRESEGRFRAVLEQSIAAIYVIQDGRIVYVNPRMREIFGYSADEQFDPDPLAHIKASDWPLVIEQIRQRLAGKGNSAYAITALRKDRSEFSLGIHAKQATYQGKPAIIAIAQDITEKERVQEALRASRDLLMSIVENAPVRVFWKDLELRYLGCNSSFARDAGVARPVDVIGKTDDQMAWKAQAAQYRADDRQVIESNVAKIGIEEPRSLPDGRRNWLRTSKVPLHDAGGKVIGILGVYDDITEQKEAEDHLRRLNWAMRALSQSNSSLVRATSEHELFESCCKAIASTNDFPLAWIGIARDDEEKSVECAAAAGEAIAYVEGLRISWGDSPLGQGPTGISIRADSAQVVADIANNASYLPWAERARAHGLASSISLPIHVAGRPVGALMIYSRHVNAFGEAEIALFKELADDLAYGITSRRLRVAYDASLLEQARAATKLRKSLEDSIQAIAATVEMRDPYTAGHERRVAEIAVAIAMEMDLPPFMVEGIRFGGMIHDLGKIQVPAEILSKPSRLSPAEFALIKGHAQSGYDILKAIDFPWPVAEMARQHHERLDGSGYPQGLKGDAILLEARVLAVADTVEAMSSHRPYRPGLGIDLALAEIEKGRGKVYDTFVVDACLRLFRGKGYQLPA